MGVVVVESYVSCIWGTELSSYLFDAQYSAFQVRSGRTSGLRVLLRSFLKTSIGVEDDILQTELLDFHQ